MRRSSSLPRGSLLSPLRSLAPRPRCAVPQPPPPPRRRSFRHPISLPLPQGRLSPVTAHAPKS
eukprot:544372-Prymnesium_polylepis.1